MAAALHFMCGRIAAGKTTLARQIAADCNGILICEDVWLDRMYAGAHFTLDDYLRRSARLRAALGPHVVELLRREMPIVFDFAGNTTQDRRWVRSLFEAAGADHQLHYLDTPDAICKERLRRRNRDAPSGSQVTTDEEFELIGKYFVAPDPSEGFRVCIHRATA